MGDTGETRDRVGAAGVAIASVFFKIALYICVIVLLFWIGKSAFQFGHDVFNQQAMSPGEGQEVTVVIKEDASLYGIAKTLQKKGLVKSAPVFYVQERLSTYHGKLKAGTYLLSTAYTPNRIMGILAGDALLNYAFETAAAAFDEYPEKALQIGKAMKILGNKAGIYGMLGGQVVDVKETGHAVDKDVLDFIYALKTGALLESSMMIGATLAGADDESIALIEKVASKVGLAFQVQDDILDVTSTAEVLGKPIHSDEKNEKTTYVTLLGIDKAEKIVEKESVEAIELLKSLPVRNDYLEWLLTQLIHRKK